MESGRLSEPLEDEIRRLRRKWYGAARHQSERAYIVQVLRDMRKFARMVEKGPAIKPSLDSAIRRQCGDDNHERVYGEDSCMCGAVDYLPSATEKARQ